MIGRLRAAWDDSRRTANHRRGTNPMSRVEWFEFVDRLDTEVVDKINALPTRETIRKAADQIRADLRVASDKPAHGCECVSAGLERRGPGRELDDDRSARAEEKDNVAEISSDGVTNRGRVLRLSDPVDAGTDVLGGLGIDLDRSATDVDQSRCLCAIRKLDDSRLTHDGAPSIDGGRRTIGNAQTLGTPFARPEILATGLDEVFSKAAPEADDSFPVADLDRFTAAQNADAEESAAKYQEFLALRRPSAAPASSATGCGSDAGCSAQVMLAGHVIDLTLTQNEYMGTVTMTVHLPEEPIWRTIVHPSLGNGDGNQVLPAHDFPVDQRLGRQGESEGSASVGTLEGAGGLLGHTSAHASAASREERVSGSSIVHESEHGEGPAGRGHCGADGGEREEAHRVGPQCQGNDDVPVTVGSDVELVGVGDENGLEFGRRGDRPFGHSASPSIDGGHRTVGEGEVTGVETAAPVTDATDREALANALQERIAHDEHSLAVLHLSELTLRGGLSTRDAARLVLDEARSKPDVRFERTHYAKCGGTCTVDNLGIRVVEGEIDASGVINSSDLGLKPPTT